MSLPPQMHENVPLAPLTTLGLGGPARYFLEAYSEQDVLTAVRWAEHAGAPLFVLGGGSNIVVSDNGFSGLVLKVALQGLVQSARERCITVTVAAGENWDSLVERAVAQKLAGIECLSGIPGTVGGTPVQNVGAYGQEVSETIVSVRALDRSTGCVAELTNTACRFAYRQSLFNTTERERYIVLSVSYALCENGAPSMKYADLQREFASRSAPSLAELRDAVLRIRRRKAMVIDPGDPDSRSAGSFFKNPLVSQQQYEAIANATPEHVPRYPASGGQVKLAAAWLIEHAGFAKGHTRGRAAISSKHTLALVNRGGATAAELLDLMREIQRGVNDRFGIELRPEPLFIGFREGETRQ